MTSRTRTPQANSTADPREIVVETQWLHGHEPVVVGSRVASVTGMLGQEAQGETRSPWCLALEASGE